jgi:hypothetical protein
MNLLSSYSLMLLQCTYRRRVVQCQYRLLWRVIKKVIIKLGDVRVLSLEFYKCFNFDEWHLVRRLNVFDG